MKKIFIILYLLIFSGCTNNTITANLSENYREGTQPFSNTVVCHLKLTGSVGKTPYKDTFEASTSKGNQPLSITLTDIDTTQPILITGDGYKVNLQRPNFNNNPNTVYMAEVTATGNLNIWTLFRKTNILTLTKQYDLGDNPFAYAMIGDCEGGV